MTQIGQQPYPFTNDLKATSANQTNKTQFTQLTGQKNDGTGIGDVQTTADGGLVINQNIQVDNGNGSTTNLNAGATFTGTSRSNMDATAIQIMLKTDQNCTMYVDQSADGTNWDITDSYPFYAAIGNFAPTINAVGSFYRVRVKNIGLSATTYFRLQAILVPILPALPRSLDEYNNLKVSIKSSTDHYGFRQENTPKGEVRSITPLKLVGTTWYGNTIDASFWTVTNSAGGTSTMVDSMLTMDTNVTANGSTIVNSARTARFVSGASNLLHVGVRFTTVGTANNIRRVGAFTATDGVFFQLSNTTLSVVTRKNSVDTVVSSGSFNGELGTTLLQDTNLHVYEIYYDIHNVYFAYDDRLVHTASITTTTWTANPHLQVRFENVNANGSVSNVRMEAVDGHIYRLGNILTSPARYHTTAAGTYVLKTGPGLLHAININGAGPVGSTLTIYDNTSAAGSVIGIIDVAKISGPIPMPYNGGTNYDIGLTLVQVGIFDTTIIFE